MDEGVQKADEGKARQGQGEIKAMSEKADSRNYGMGYTFKRGLTWWVQYSFDGTRHRESSHSQKEADATKLLKRRIAEMEGGHVVGAAGERLTVPQLCDNLIAHLKLEGAKAVPSFESHLKPIRKAFALVRAARLTTKQIRHYVEERKAAEKAHATINRETGALRQALNLAHKDGLLRYVPHVPMLTEDNARQGFFERADFEAIVAKLDDPINDVARFAYLTGWRRGEVVPLRWARVNRQAHEIRLATSKNGEPRVLGYDEGSDLDALIERRWQESGGSEYVFHSDGAPVVDFRKAWARACRAAGLVKPCDSCDGVPAKEDDANRCRRCDGHGTVPSHLFHDFRRTAVRDMVRAGVPETVAMSISGHKTRSVFDRYNIADEKDRREAQRRVQAYRATQPSERERDNVIPMGGSSAA
jgi:integrase